MTPTVLIELSRADESSSYTRAMLDACDIAMSSRGRCVLGQDMDRRDDGGAVVAVVWDGPSRAEAHIEAEASAPSGRVRRSRVLRFVPDDPEVERWRTAGFAIATLVGEVVAPIEPVQTVAGPPGAQPLVVSDARSVSASGASSEIAPARSWIDGRFVLARGVSGFAPAPGAELGFSRRLLDGGAIFLTGAARCTFQSGEPHHVSIVRPNASAGGGIFLVPGGSRFQVALRLDAVLEVIAATVADSATGASDSGTRWLPGVAENVDASWMWSGQFGLVVGIEATEGAATDIRAHNQVIARLPSLELTGQAGLRFGFP